MSKNIVVNSSGPDWTKAPRCAEWAAVDRNGALFWYSSAPYTTSDLDGVWRGDALEGDVIVELDGIHWSMAIWQRPDDTIHVSDAAYWRGLVAQYLTLRSNAETGGDTPSDWEKVAEVEQQLAQLAIRLFTEPGESEDGEE